MYLDYASSTPLNKEVYETYVELLKTHFANCDSLYSIGREGSELLNRSRALVANLLRVNTNNIIFTASGSEANAMALIGHALLKQKLGKHIITTSIEHPSVLKACEQLYNFFGFEITYLKCNEVGEISLSEFKQALRSDTVLVSMMSVNNEIGCILPIEEFAKYTHEYSRASFHSDMVQAIGKEATNLEHIDMASFSAHKINGMKGSGILYLKDNIKILPLIPGGQQEFGLRGGTTPWQLHTLWAKTLRIALNDLDKKYQDVVELAKLLSEELTKIDNIKIHKCTYQSPYILNFATTLGSEILLNALNEKEIYISAHSTCASKNKQLSHVLLACGYSEGEVAKSVRVSLSSDTSKVEILLFVKTLKEILHEYSLR